MSFECPRCNSCTRMNVMVGISAPGELSHQFSKSNLRRKDVWLTHVNWETADYICTNPECRHTTNGYGNYVTRLKQENAALREAAKGRVNAGHNDTCGSLLVPGAPCSCCHDRLSALLQEGME